MDERFADARLKIDRANKHIRDAEDVVLSLVQSFTVAVSHDPDTGVQNLVHAAPELTDARVQLSLITGDAVHNLRSALDYAWLATLKKHVPTADLRRVKFPVRDSRKELETALNGVQINPTSNSAIFDLLMSNIQPYEGGKNGVVYTLHELDICDKHLLRLSIKPLAGISGIVLEKPDGEIVHGFGATVESCGPYVIPFHKDIRLKQEGTLSINVVLDEAGNFNGVHVVDLLRNFSRAVLYYVQLMEAL